MGLDRLKKTPCGFCFVEYFTREDAEKSVQFLCDTKLDERTIRVDYDVGFKEGRQYGRGRSGGQVRDEHRADYDPGRGGFGKANNSSMSGNEMWGNQEPERPFHHMNQPPPPQYGPPYGMRQPPHFGQTPPPMFHEGNQHNGPPPSQYMYRRGRGGRGRGRGRGGPPMGPPHMPPPPRYFDGNGPPPGGPPPPPGAPPPPYGHPMYGKRYRDESPHFQGHPDMNMQKRHRQEIDDMHNQQ